MKPKRIQLSRKKGWRMPANTVKVDRSTKWGNPFRVGNVVNHPAGGLDLEVNSALHAVSLFGAYICETVAGERMARAAKLQLKGKNLACWCKPGTPCHADVLLRIANEK